MTVLRHAVFVNMAFSYENKILVLKHGSCGKDTMLYNVL